MKRKIYNSTIFKFLKQILNKAPNSLVVAIYVFCYRLKTINRKFDTKQDKKLFYQEIKNSFENRARVIKGKYVPNETVYIIHRVSDKEGHNSIINSFLGHLKYAQEHNLTPVIDMKNYYSYIWQYKDNKYKENAWEYFYKQPVGLSLKDALSSKNILLSRGDDVRELPKHDSVYFNTEEILKWNRIYKQYIHFNKTTKDYVDNVISSFELERYKYLAVCLRRGVECGYLLNEHDFLWYEKPPALDEVIQKVENLLKEWSCDKIFLVIDDNEGLEKFSEHFGDKLKYIERKRPAFFRNGKPILKEERVKISPLTIAASQDEIYTRERAFLAETYFMAKCQSVLCAKTSASATAFVINGGQYEHTYVY